MKTLAALIFGLTEHMLPRRLHHEAQKKTLECAMYRLITRPEIELTSVTRFEFTNAGHFDFNFGIISEPFTRIFFNAKYMPDEVLSTVKIHKDLHIFDFDVHPADLATYIADNSLLHQKLTRYRGLLQTMHRGCLVDYLAKASSIMAMNAINEVLYKTQKSL